MYEDYDIDRLHIEILKLINEGRDIKKRIKKIPFYRIRERWKLYWEWRNLIKKTKDAGGRLKKVAKSPIQIISRD